MQDTIFVNFSNHPSSRWDELQRKEAEKYGEIVDMPFPDVPTDYDEGQIEELALKYTNQIKNMNGQIAAAMVQGEYTLTYAIVRALRDEGINVLSACSQRDVKVETDKEGNKIKVTKFTFSRFRRYQ